MCKPSPTTEPDRSRFQFSLRFLFLLTTAVAIVSNCYAHLGQCGCLLSAMTFVACYESIYFFRLARTNGKLSDALFGTVYLGYALVCLCLLLYVAWHRDSLHLQ
jgi:hypothetical protein